MHSHERIQNIQVFLYNIDEIIREECQDQDIDLLSNKKKQLKILTEIQNQVELCIEETKDELIDLID